MLVAKTDQTVVRLFHSKVHLLLSALIKATPGHPSSQDCVAAECLQHFYNSGLPNIHGVFLLSGFSTVLCSPYCGSVELISLLLCNEQ